MSILGDNIRFWRKREGLSQEKFAKKLGINRGKLATYEESVEPRQEFLLALVDNFQVNLHNMLTRRMTAATFDSFFIGKDELEFSLASSTFRSQVIEQLMYLKTPDNSDKVDKLIIAVSRMMEENHDLREELLILLKKMRQ